MIKTTLNWTVKNLKHMYDAKETLSFDHPIQRQSAQWSNLQQSLLIHSILANFPVPAIYVQKSDAEEADDKGKTLYKYSVLDGKQRMTTIFSFINGEYALNEETPDAEIEGENYSLAGKTFGELDVDVQQELLRFKFQMFAFEDCTDDMIEEIFFRLNNSTPLTKPQKSKPLMGVENAKFIDSILTGSFFSEKCNFSKLQLRKSDDMCTLLQSMMLLDHKYQGYEYASISADEVMKYSAIIKGNYSEEQKELLVGIIDYLDNVFDAKEKMLRKINIPMAILMADLAMKEGICESDFHDWFLYFFVSNKEYSQYCSSGSVKKEKVLGRLTIMENHFSKHFKLDAPSESENSSGFEAEIPEEIQNESGEQPDTDPVLSKNKGDSETEEISGQEENIQTLDFPMDNEAESLIEQGA